MPPRARSASAETDRKPAGLAAVGERPDPVRDDDELSALLAAGHFGPFLLPSLNSDGVGVVPSCCTRPAHLPPSGLFGALSAKPGMNGGNVVQAVAGGRLARSDLDGEATRLITARKPSSSVTSSPTKTGRRPEKGGVPHEIPMAPALVTARGRISAIAWPSTATSAGSRRGGLGGDFARALRLARGGAEMQDDRAALVLDADRVARPDQRPRTCRRADSSRAASPRVALDAVGHGGSPVRERRPPAAAPGRAAGRARRWRGR